MNSVPSAVRGLTALFEMGRGEHPPNGRHEGRRWTVLSDLSTNIFNIFKLCYDLNGERKKEMKKYRSPRFISTTRLGVTTFRPVAYQRHRL